ncbi:hypothetical protein T492DRAFT_870058 [Pavlovales sp. CCMP2436]|nr:hypothetical protein T492DRAFT_870058 [Pavlovales sp. CCMP2436]
MAMACWLAALALNGGQSGPCTSPAQSWLSSVRPSIALSSAEAIELSLLAMQGGDIDGGAALWLRFSAPSFCLAAIEPWGAPALALAVRDSKSQYSLLADSRLAIEFPTEPVERFDSDGIAVSWHEVELELRPGGRFDSEGYTAAKLGWENEWSSKGWCTRHVSWHDFRPAFRPGIGQEEWPRICG